ncbi:MAG: hypothetical protein DCF18_06440 [Cyanobium sp.]|uniref:hypothetical protein n=1 Tax=Synechococcus sp. CS-1333 TaxID=2848638 RepID=UPI000DBBF00F|nr:hypothetical protein [Synechococcus sp. CS-1333]MCT0209761.1 hypothetical protein [Synechococcus sp. CS-1333]PZV23451.1 MAG: hypothetical protein DCF18_06440 [Cyanobium sp.]
MVGDQAALLNDLQQASAKLLPEADALLARYCALPAAEGADPLGKLWQAAELAQRRGRLTVAMGLLRTIDALSVAEQLTPLRRRALERAERLAYLQADLEAAGQLRERLRQLLAASNHPDDHAQVKSEPLRQWRLELAADQQALRALRALEQQDHDPATAVRQLAALVQRHPQATAVAFVLQQRLRHVLMEEAAPPLPATAGRIPAKLWLLRRYPGSNAELEALEGHWRQQLPDWELAWLDHNAVEEAAQVEVPPLVRAACHGVNDPAVRGDLLRLAMLWLHGGVAPEWNTRPLQPLTPLLDGAELLLCQDDDLGISLELVAAAPQHPWVGAALEQACLQALDGQAYSRWDLTGACLLSGVFARWAAPTLAQGALPAGLQLVPLPSLRRQLALGVALPRPVGLPEEEPVTQLFHHRRRRQARRWLEQGEAAPEERQAC